MNFSRTYKGRMTKEGLYVVKDVKAKELKDLGIKYKLLHNYGNWAFLIKRKDLPKLINLVEDRFKLYWKNIIDKEMKAVPQ